MFKRPYNNKNRKSGKFIFISIIALLVVFLALMAVQDAPPLQKTIIKVIDNNVFLEKTSIHVN